MKIQKSPFWIRKSVIQKIRFGQKSRTHIPEKGVWKVILYAPHFFAGIGCIQEAIAKPSLVLLARPSPTWSERTPMLIVTRINSFCTFIVYSGTPIF